MADAKISALTAATTPVAGTEVLPIVQSGTTKKVSIANLTAGRDVGTKNLIATGQGVFQGGLDNFWGASGALYAYYSGGTGALASVSDAIGTAAPFAIDASTQAFRVAGVNRLNINGSGIVRMSAYGAGAATFDASGVISSVSDETWKVKDGVPADPVSMLKGLQPGYWYYTQEKQDLSFTSDRQLGFYAQNVNACIGPEAAPEPEEGKPWGYYDRSILAVVVMSLQNAIKRIEFLESELSKINNP